MANEGRNDGERRPPRRTAGGPPAAGRRDGGGARGTGRGGEPGRSADRDRPVRRDGSDRDRPVRRDDRDRRRDGNIGGDRRRISGSAGSRGPTRPDAVAPDDSGGTGPRLPPDVEARQLAPEVRRELTTLDRSTADYVARHLVTAGDLLDDDPDAALEHAKAARGRAARIAAVREAVGIAAYRCGDWAQALAELRAARRMGSKSPLLAMIADCERGVGRPERAIELARSADAALLTGDDADELRIVAAGARADLGQLDQALAVLSTPQLDPTATGATAARIAYAYADTLLALDRRADALHWFLAAAAADLDGVTDAEERVTDLT